MAGSDAQKGLQLTLRVKKRDIMVGGEFLDMHPRQPWVAHIYTDDKYTLRVCNYEDEQQGTSPLYRDVGGLRGILKARFLGDNDSVLLAQGYFPAQLDKARPLRYQSWVLFVYKILQTPHLQMQKEKTLTGMEDSSWAKFTVHPTARCILSVADSGCWGDHHDLLTISFWDVDHDLHRKTHFRGSCISETVFHSVERHIFLTGHKDGTIKMWDTNSMAVLQTFYKSQTLRGAKGRVVTSLRFCASRPQTSLLIAGHASGTIQVWDYQRKECMATLDVHEQKVVQAFFHPHLPYILSASCDGTVMAWSDSDYQLQYTLCSGLTGLSDGILCRNDSMLGLYSKEEALRFITLEHNGPKRNDFENSVKMEVGNAIEESDKRLWFEKTDAHSIKSLVAELISVRVKRRALEEGLEKERETHAQRMNEVESELSDVRTERQVLGVRFETLQEEHEREKGMLLERVDELGSQITNLMTEREELKERMERSKVRIQELESRLEMDGGVGERSERFDGVPSVVPQVEFLHPLREFSLDELKTATNDFHDDSKVEHRHYGCVYVGKTTPVVVKRFDGGNNMTRDKHVQLTRDFVDLLKSLEHPHLQKLLGVCYGGNCLVYEHMASGSVKEWISSIEGSRRGFLPWCVRLRIMAQVAQALAFLHSSKSLGGGPIIHRAIKPENILLGTSNLVAKLAEVDAALLAPDSKDVDAAPGMPMSNRADAQYMAPEFLHREVFTQQTDIYAFGITILEILTGKFKDAFGSMEDAVDDPAVFGSTLDPNAGSWDVQLAMEAAQVGLRCANPNRRLRPSMRTGEGAILPALESIASKVELADSIEDVRRMSLCE